ncbi:DNA-binding protein [Burkholderia sp. BCCIQ04A]|uniref:DNA-binding protein n=1 Tax=Burkholderia anthinoferrum TaxID=3090833 RepID=A0ABU5WP84_9BURK|nr:DNA-binding protein [Burkholderia anthinoferrum]MEB2504612.1 DNA-binding protein [Burkholderia anthinoferrum]MEB2530281.1 DNA-binding protein [Burkholderia anthinoferrum]MEB2561654.1 DNA-binding protein [Burkholderia anthinoferrum]MEB2580596.1 DNA-binding protein [Burkholderia anthinoferrum]MEB2634426.1 DNA-binding protein [Burkholderia anthinoferrum]
MNPVAQPISFTGSRSTPIVERLLREAMADPKAKAAVLEATGWDASMPSKILSNGAGITLEHLNTVFSALGLVVTTKGYMDYLAQGNVIGSNCRCAREGFGECSGR